MLKSTIEVPIFFLLVYLFFYFILSLQKIINAVHNLSIGDAVVLLTFVAGLLAGVARFARWWWHYPHNSYIKMLEQQRKEAEIRGNIPRT